MIGVKMSQRIGQKDSKPRAATWKKFPKPILITIQLSTKLNNFLVKKKTSTNLLKGKKSHTPMKPRPWLLSDHADILRQSLLLLPHSSPREWTRQLLVQKLLKFWKNTLRTPLKAGMKKPLLRLFASPRVDSSMIHLLTKHVKVPTGEEKNNTKTMGCLEGVAAVSWGTTATKKMWWEKLKKRQQRR